MLEAMYFSKPIIAPSISAIPEVVKNEINGLIVRSMMFMHIQMQC